MKVREDGSFWAGGELAVAVVDVDLVDLEMQNAAESSVTSHPGRGLTAYEIATPDEETTDGGEDNSHH